VPSKKIKRKDSAKKMNGNQVFNVEDKQLKKIPKWKQQSEQFRRAMNRGKEPVSSYDLGGLKKQAEE